MEIRRSMASPIKGNEVPINTTKVAVKSSRLLPNKKVSRDSNLKPALFCNKGARMANNNKDPPATTAKKIKIKVPRAGTLAKACTEVSTPERTKNVPSKLKEKVKMANNTVQARNKLRFSVTANECSNAVPESQGIKEAFSTGSQNHQPPQPNS